MSKNGAIILTVVLAILVVGLGAYFINLQSAPAGNDSYSASPAPPPSAPAPSPSPTPSSTKTSTSTLTSPTSKTHMITLKTSMGDITFETYDADAPNTVKNFITLAQKGFYDNVIFHRVIKGFMIQGGDPTGTGRGGPGYAFADELNPATPSYQAGYKKGVVAMANAGPDTNGSQFFIMLADTALPHNYTIFGKVTAGQDVVDAIGNLPTGAGDRPQNPPVIKSVTVNGKP